MTGYQSELYFIPFVLGFLLVLIDYLTGTVLLLPDLARFRCLRLSLPISAVIA